MADQQGWWIRKWNTIGESIYLFLPKWISQVDSKGIKKSYKSIRTKRIDEEEIWHSMRLQQVSEIEDGRVNKEQNLQDKCLQRETLMKNKPISLEKSIDKGDRYHRGWGRLGGWLNVCVQRSWTSLYAPRFHQSAVALHRPRAGDWREAEWF